MRRLWTICLLTALIAGSASSADVRPELRVRAEKFVAMMSGELDKEAFIAEEMSPAFLERTPAHRPLMIFGVLQDFYKGQAASLQSIRETPDAVILELSNFENRWAEYELLLEPGDPELRLGGFNARILGTPAEDDWKGLTSDALVGRLRDYVNSLASQGKFSGSVILARGDEILLDASRGDLGGKSVTSETTLPVASVSKSFTAAAIWNLASIGEIDLDEAISTYLPDFSKLPIGKASSREILEHRAGLQSFTMLDETTESLPRTSLGELARAYAREPLIEKEATVYSNAGAVLLGYLIESVAAMPFDRFLHETVFDPSGMQRSGFLPVGPETGSVTWNRFEEPQSGERVATSIWFEGCVDPAKSAVATASDLHRFTRKLFSGAIAGDATIRDLVQRSQDPDREFAYGLRLASENGVLALGHTGALPGVAAQWWYFPESQYGIFVIGDRSEAAEGIAERFRTGISFGEK